MPSYGRGMLRRSPRRGYNRRMPLHVIDGTPAPDTPTERVRKRVRAMDTPAGMLQCPRCGGRETLDTRIGATTSGGGTKQRLCAACFLRGERVVIV